MLHMIGNSVIRNMDYPVFSENSPAEMKVGIFNTEYRVLQKMKRIEGKCSSYHTMMRELLTAANGVIAYDFPVKFFLSQIKEYRNEPEGSVLPMTIIAWKHLSGRMVCSVERIFVKWDNWLPLEDNLFFNAYMEHSDQVTLKLLREHYYPLGVIGKGDYIKTLRKVFVDQFGYKLI